MKHRLLIGGGVLLVVLGLAMATLSPTWIEQTLGAEPDGGDGWLELLFALVPLTLGVVSLALGIRQVRRPNPDGAGATPGGG